MPRAKLERQFLASSVAAGFAFVAGTALGWTNPVSMSMETGELGFTMNTEELSWVTSIVQIGAILACIPSGILIDTIGRRWSLIMLVVPFSIGWLFKMVAVNIWMLYAGRFFLGIACGLCCISIPVYTAETSDKEIRGILGSFFALYVACGILFVLALGVFMKPMDLTIVCAILPYPFTLAMFFMPQSPLFQMQKGNEDGAVKALAWLHDKNYDAHDDIEHIRRIVAERAAKQKKYFAGLKSWTCFKAFYITMGCMSLAQVSGISPVIYYLTFIFERAESSMDPQISAVIFGVMQILGLLIATCIVDKIGRRFLLMGSVAFTALSSFTLACYFYIYEKDMKAVKGLGWIPLTALSVFVITFSVGLGAVPWILIGELFPPDVRGKAGAIVNSCYWLWGFFISKLFLPVQRAIGFGLTFGLFSILTAFGLFFVYFFVPETKGKSLIEIQEMLSSNAQKKQEE